MDNILSGEEKQLIAEHRQRQQAVELQRQADADAALTHARLVSEALEVPTSQMNAEQRKALRASIRDWATGPR